METTANQKLGELIVAIADGNISAIGEVYAPLGKVMYSVAAIYAAQPADAEDIVHDSLIKIVRQAKSFRENKNAYAWVNTVVKNTALDYLRRARSRKEEFETEEKEYVINENAMAIREAFQILTEPERDLMTYIYWYGMTLEEIGKLLHITKSAVKKRADKILLKLKKFFEK